MCDSIKIQYMEKPEWVSWEAIADCLHDAHAINKTRGFEMKGLKMTPDELEKKVGKGYCLVAWDGDMVVGTTTLTYQTIKKNLWLRYWTKGKPFLYSGLTGVRREYQGSEVYFELQKLKNKIIEDSGVEIVGYDTAENNKVILKMAKKNGGKFILFTSTRSNNNYYSIYVLKWLHGCPYPDWYINMMFHFTKIVVKTLWKPGRKLRFWFN